MKIVVVGMITYSVENIHAAVTLEAAAEATEAGNFVLAAELKKLAGRIESGKQLISSPDHVQHLVAEVKNQF